MRVKLLNVEIDNYTMNEAVDYIDHMICNGSRQYVVTPNVDHIVRLEKDEVFKKIYAEADLVLADGKPLIWISKWLGTPIVEKVSGSDLFPRICQRAAERGYRLFLLGAAQGVAKKAAENLCKKHPGLVISGTYSPPYNFENSPEELNKVFKMINASRTDILIIGLGSPKQEKFFYNYRDKMNVSVAMNLGASIDFEAGHVKRAPKWMQELGFEWLYRLIKEPRRLAKRYLIDDMQIIRLYFKYRGKT